MQSKRLKIIMATVFLFAALTSCYRMPREGEYSVIPTMNNPAILRTSNQPTPMIPGGGF